MSHHHDDHHSFSEDVIGGLGLITAILAVANSDALCGLLAFFGIWFLVLLACNFDFLASLMWPVGCGLFGGAIWAVHRLGLRTLTNWVLVVLGWLALLAVIHFTA